MADFTAIGGARYIQLSRFSEKFNVQVDRDPVSQVAKLTAEGAVIKVMPGSNIALVDGSAKEFSPETRMKGGDIYIPPSLAEYIIKNYLREKLYERGARGARGVSEPRPAIRRVVIDAGHGGKDPGALSRRGIKEKHIVLDIAKRLRDELKARGGFNVIMTRDSDRFVTLKERARIANNAKADLYISIHANAARAKSANGFEVYYLSNAMDDDARAMEVSENKVVEFEDNTGDKSDYLNATLWDMILTENRDESKELAGRICESSRGGYCLKTRGVKSARFYVLKGTNMPSVLVEVGYVSNSQEAKNLNIASYRQKIAGAIADGVIAHAREFERTEGFTK